MAKPTPEDIAAKMAAKVQRMQDATASGLADSELGRQVLRMLAGADTVSRAQLLRHFGAVADDVGLAKVERALAGEIIRRLQTHPRK